MVKQQSHPYWGGMGQGQRRAFLRLAGALAVLAGVLGVTGCGMPIGTGSGLGKAMPTARPCRRRAWLAPVEIVDPIVSNKGRVQEALRLSIVRFIREGKYFADTNLLPGDVGQDDVVLRVRFGRYQQTRSAHPAYLPAALLTLTVYIWAGGPIFVDRADLTGQLRIETAGGTEMATVESQLAREQNTSVWSPDYFLPSGAVARTEVVRDLLDKGVKAISQKGATTP